MTNESDQLEPVTNSPAQDAGITSVRFVRERGKAWQAILRFNEESGALRELADTMRADGLVVDFTLSKGGNALRISGIKDDLALVDNLVNYRLFTPEQADEFKIRKEAAEKGPEPKNLFEKAVYAAGGKTNGQRVALAGALYAIGDYISIGKGVLRNSWGDVGFGIAANISTLPMILYGNRPTGRTEAQELVHDMKERFRKSDVSSYAEGITNEDPASIWQAFDGFMERHKINIGNAGNAISGLFKLKAGLEGKGGHINEADVVSGLLISVGWGTAWLMPERGVQGSYHWGEYAKNTGVAGSFRNLADSPLGQSVAKNPLARGAADAGGKIFDWAHEKPRRVAGRLAFLHNWVGFGSTINEWIKSPKDMRKIEKAYHVQGEGDAPPVVDPLFTGSNARGETVPFWKMKRDELTDFVYGKEKDGQDRRTGGLFNETRKHNQITKEQADKIESDYQLYQENRQNMWGGWLNAAMITCYMAANNIYATTSGRSEEELDLSELYAESAKLMLRQPEQWQRMALLKEMADYVSSRPEVQAMQPDVTREELPVMVAFGILGAATHLVNGPFVNPELAKQAEQTAEAGEAVPASHPADQQAIDELAEYTRELAMRRNSIQTGPAA